MLDSTAASGDLWEMFSYLAETQAKQAPLPSPGRESGVLNCKLKRQASVNFAPEKKPRTLNKKKRSCERKKHGTDPRQSLGLRPLTLADLAEYSGRGNEDEIRELESFIAEALNARFLLKASTP